MENPLKRILRKVAEFEAQARKEIVMAYLSIQEYIAKSIQKVSGRPTIDPEEQEFLEEIEDLLFELETSFGSFLDVVLDPKPFTWIVRSRKDGRIFYESEEIELVLAFLRGVEVAWRED